MLKELNIANVVDLDFGKVGVAYERELERAVRDCMDRPGDDRVRKVTLQMELVPIANTEGTTIDCEAVNGKFKVKCSMPDYESGVVNFGVRNNGRLVFAEDSPRDHRQGVLGFEDREGDYDAERSADDAV